MDSSLVSSSGSLETDEESVMVCPSPLNSSPAFTTSLWSRNRNLLDVEGGASSMSISNKVGNFAEQTLGGVQVKLETPALEIIRLPCLLLLLPLLRRVATC